MCRGPGQSRLEGQCRERAPIHRRYSVAKPKVHSWEFLPLVHGGTAKSHDQGHSPRKGKIEAREVAEHVGRGVEKEVLLHSEDERVAGNRASETI